jgi:hypothetical protein
MAEHPASIREDPRMSGAMVRWRRAEENFDVSGVGRMWFSDQTTVVAALEVIGPASLTELRRAVARCRRDMYPGDYRFDLFDAPADQLASHEDMFLAEPISLTLGEERTTMTVALALASEEPAEGRDEVSELLAPILRRTATTIVEFSADEQTTATVQYLTVEVNARGRTVGEVIHLGFDLLQLWGAGVGGQLTPTTVADLIRAQRADLLVGTAENEWFEAKGAAYSLGDDLDEIELAKDVSALANRPEGGLLVVGLVTRKRAGRDVVVCARPQPLTSMRPGRYRQRLDKWIYPRLRDAVVEAVETGPGEGLLVILIPPQPEPLWPFLVSGAVVGRKYLGNHFSLVRRRGDETVDDPAAVAHGLMVAGRAALSVAPRQPPPSGETTTV